MKIIECQQGSEEWFRCRLGIPTASEFDALVTPLWKLRTGEGVESYLARKLAERWRGEPLPQHQSAAMEQGQVRESEAIPWFEFETGESVRRVGFISSDDSRYGCSPDGLLKVGGLEVKCPECHTHVKYLLSGELPNDYKAQVQGSMFVTGAPTWRFMSYCPGFPPLLLEVKRDEKAQQAIAEALDAFTKRLDEGYARLVDANGGPPERRTLVETQAKIGQVFDASMAYV